MVAQGGGGSYERSSHVGHALQTRNLDVCYVQQLFDEYSLKDWSQSFVIGRLIDCPPQPAGRSYQLSLSAGRLMKSDSTDMSSPKVHPDEYSA